MDLKLVVVRPFAGFARGDVIADPTRIADVLASEHAASVVRVHADLGERNAAAMPSLQPASVNQEG